MIHHTLKIEERFWQRHCDGVKPFEVRLNDRDYQVGDYVSFPGKSKDIYKITYIHSGLGMSPGYVILMIEFKEK